MDLFYIKYIDIIHGQQWIITDIFNMIDINIIPSKTMEYYGSIWNTLILFVENNGIPYVLYQN